MSFDLGCRSFYYRRSFARGSSITVIGETYYTVDDFPTVFYRPLIHFFWCWLFGHSFYYLASSSEDLRSYCCEFCGKKKLALHMVTIEQKN